MRPYEAFLAYSNQLAYFELRKFQKQHVRSPLETSGGERRTCVHDTQSIQEKAVNMERVITKPKNPTGTAHRKKLITSV